MGRRRLDAVALGRRTSCRADDRRLPQPHRPDHGSCGARVAGGGVRPRGYGPRRRRDPCGVAAGRAGPAAPRGSVRPGGDGRHGRVDEQGRVGRTAAGLGPRRPFADQRFRDDPRRLRHGQPDVGAGACGGAARSVGGRAREPPGAPATAARRPAHGVGPTCARLDLPTSARGSQHVGSTARAGRRRARDGRGAEGILVTAGPAFSVDGTFEHHVRLPYTAAPEVLEEAVRRLADLAGRSEGMTGPAMPFAPEPHPASAI